MLDIRREEYSLNGFIETALKYFKGDIPKHKQRGVMDNLRGYELAIYLAEQLQAQGANVQLEVGDIKADVVAEKDGEVIAYECKTSRELNSKVLRQIKGYKGHYKNVSLFVLKDTCIKRELENALREQDVQIERADISREQLINRVLRIQGVM